MCRETIQVIVFALMLSCFVHTASAKPIALVTGNNYLPFTDETLPQRGMITEIVDLVFKEIGYQPTITFRPWKRGYEETKKGLFAATFPYIKTDERLQQFYYSDPINTIYTRIFVTKDSSIKKFADLQGRRICIPLGYGITRAMDDMLRQDFVKQEGSPVNLSNCLKMMLSGRKDFFIINEIHGWMTIQNTFHTKESFRTLDIVFEELTHHLIISKAYPHGEEVLSQFNKGLEKLSKSGAIQEIIQRHLKDIIE